jgi:hypothetical protein
MDWAPILAFVTGMFSGALSCTHDSWRCDSHHRWFAGTSLKGLTTFALLSACRQSIFNSRQAEGIDLSFSICSHCPMDELRFKIVRMQGSRDEVIARVENFLICKTEFEKALFVYPDAHLEMRQGKFRLRLLGGNIQRKPRFFDSPGMRGRRSGRDSTGQDVKATKVAWLRNSDSDSRTRLNEARSIERCAIHRQTVEQSVTRFTHVKSSVG